MCSLHARRVDTTFTSLFPFPSFPPFPPFPILPPPAPAPAPAPGPDPPPPAPAPATATTTTTTFAKKKRFSPPVRSGLLVYIRALLLLLLLLLRRFRCFLNCGPCRASTASSVGRQLQARDRCGACRNSSASSRSLAALPQVKGTTQ